MHDLSGRPRVQRHDVSTLALSVCAVAGGAGGSAVTTAQAASAPATPRKPCRPSPDVRNVMVIYGSARPPAGPVDIVVEDGLISYIGADRAAGRGPDGGRVIDATGKYVMPGIVNTHMHWHEERQPGHAAADSVRAQPLPGRRRHHGARGRRRLRQVRSAGRPRATRTRSISPRILVYPVVSKGSSGRPEEIRAWIRDIAPQGADGLKIIAMDRDQLEAILDEAQQLGLRTADAHRRRRDDREGLHRARRHVDRALLRHRRRRADGVQSYRPEMNYNNEIHRFGRAGEL